MANPSEGVIYYIVTNNMYNGLDDSIKHYFTFNDGTYWYALASSISAEDMGDFIDFESITFDKSTAPGTPVFP